MVCVQVTAPSPSPSSGDPGVGVRVRVTMGWLRVVLHSLGVCNADAKPLGARNFVDATQHRLAARFNDSASHDDFVEHRVRLARVEDEVELADVLEAAVERLHEHVYKVEYAQLRLVFVNERREVERGEVPVDELHALAESLCILDEVAQAISTAVQRLEHVSHEFLLPFRRLHVRGNVIIVCEGLRCVAL